MPAWVFASLRLRNASKLWLTVSTLLSKLDVSPRQRADLAPAEPHRDGEEVADVARGLDLELVDELSHASRREGPLLLGVDFGRRHLVDGVAHDDLALNEVAEHEVEGLVDLVQVGPARRLSRERVALAHRRVHALDHLGVMRATSALPMWRETALKQRR